MGVRIVEELGEKSPKSAGFSFLDMNLMILYNSWFYCSHETTMNLITRNSGQLVVLFVCLFKPPLHLGGAWFF